MESKDRHVYCTVYGIRSLINVYIAIAHRRCGITGVGSYTLMKYRIDSPDHEILKIDVVELWIANNTTYYHIC